MRHGTPEGPFVGLRPFESSDSVLFFGREEQTVALLQQLHRNRFVAVVGSSGSGKSSLVRAGLIPKLQGGFLAGDRDRWHVAVMKPGQDPLANLEKALESVTGRAPEALIDAGTRSVLDVVEPLFASDDANLLLLVDQFEELFRYSARGSDGIEHQHAAEFVKIVLDLIREHDMPIYIAITMRSDFLGDCDLFRGLPEALNRSQYLVPRLTRQQLRTAIVGPIRLFRTEITDSLVSRLLNDAGRERDSLPIVQHALLRTWHIWRTQYDWRGGGVGQIDHSHYEAAGTLQWALSEHAEDALTGMTGKERRLTERIFRALSDIDDSNRRIRRPARLSELKTVTGVGKAEILGIVERFRSEGRSFLVLSDDASDPLIDISHESLIRQWGTLRKWVDTEAEASNTFKRLAGAAQRHREGKGALLVDRDLEVAINWRQESAPSRAWAQRYGGDYSQTMSFLEESRQRCEEKRKEEERLKWELEGALEREVDTRMVQIESHERRLRRFKSLVIALALIAALLWIGG